MVPHRVFTGSAGRSATAGSMGEPEGLSPLLYPSLPDINTRVTSSTQTRRLAKSRTVPHGVRMKIRSLALASFALVVGAASPTLAQAQTQIQWWHAMPGPLGEWVND